MNSSSDVVIHSPESHQSIPLNPWQIVRQLWRQRQLLRQLTNRAVQQRFRGSALGLLWAMLNPIFMLLVYTFVFSFVLRIRSWNGQGTSFVFAMNLFCGLIVYGIFAESVGAASIQVLSNPSYVKKILFPLEILPLAGLGAAIIFNLFGLAVLLVCTQFFLSPLSVHAIALPIVWVPLFLLTAGLSWIVGALGVFVRDIGQLIIIILQVVFYLCPIIYPLSAMLSRLPIALQRLYLWLNPLAVSVEETRQVLLQHCWPTLTWMLLNYAISLLVFIFGYYVFMKAKRGFADVI
ncbi:MAG: ABC transporter permease [Tepidisphaeraceae bacterium]|jgi:lipopolysaccharide transport system permease protein